MLTKDLLYTCTYCYFFGAPVLFVFPLTPKSIPHISTHNNSQSGDRSNPHKPEHTYLNTKEVHVPAQRRITKSDMIHHRTIDSCSLLQTDVQVDRNSQSSCVKQIDSMKDYFCLGTKKNCAYVPFFFLLCVESFISQEYESFEEQDFSCVKSPL